MAGGLDAIDKPRLEPIAVATTIIGVDITSQDGCGHFPAENPIAHEPVDKTGEVVCGRKTTTHRTAGDATIPGLRLLPSWIPASGIRTGPGRWSPRIAKRGLRRAVNLIARIRQTEWAE